MKFPVIFHLFGFSIHAHLLFETLGYAIGFQLYLFLRRLRRERRVDSETLLWLIAGCITGAMVGSKLLVWAESWPDYWAHRHEPLYWLGGKTIAGGLIGGWAGVEIVKKIMGIRVRTGDGYVLPLCLGIAIGRVGCFLSGLDDHTHGIATSLPWGVDYGDGIARHPTQLYEAALLIGFGVATTAFLGIRRDAGGMIFRAFMLTYMGYRFAVEFIKPSWKGYAGLSAIQWASLVAFAVAGYGVLRIRSRCP